MNNKMWATFSLNPLSIYFRGSVGELNVFLKDIAEDNFPEKDRSDEIDYNFNEDEE